MIEERPTRDPSVARMLRGLAPYVRRTWGLLAVGSAASMLSNAAIVLPAILLGRALDAVIGWQAGRLDAAGAGRAILAWAGGVVLVEVPRILRRWLLQTANNRMRTRLRADAVRGVLAWPLDRLHGIATGDLMARIIGDVEVVGTGLKALTIGVWEDVFQALVTLGTLLFYNPGLTVRAVAPVPVAMLLAHATRRWVGGRTAAAREANAALTATLQEQLAGARLLRLAGRTAGAVERVRRLADAQATMNVAVVRLREGLVPVYTVLMTAGVVLVIWQGGRDVAANRMTLGTFVAYLELFLRFSSRGHRIPRFLNRLQSAGAAWERLAPLLPLRRPERPPGGEGRTGDAPRQPESPAQAFSFSHIGGEGVEPPDPPDPAGAVGVELRGATFRYPGAFAPALAGISLSIAPGEFIAVTGPVGSGKSALARVMLGLYPLESGEVRWDGLALARIPAGVRARRSGYLPQDAGLFSGTIRENIRMRWPAEPEPADQGAVAAIAARAALADDLAGFPRGLDTEIGETGIRISGGQRQRVALARALAATLPGSPGLLLLDDPFAAVDAETEAAIVRTLVGHHGRQAPPDRRLTLVLLSHRLAAFPQADRIVVLGDGAIREAGTHAALMQAGGVYARIFSAQSRASGDSPR